MGFFSGRSGWVVKVQDRGCTIYEEDHDDSYTANQRKTMLERQYPDCRVVVNNA